MTRRAVVFGAGGPAANGCEIGFAAVSRKMGWICAMLTCLLVRPQELGLRLKSPAGWLSTSLSSARLSRASKGRNLCRRSI